MNNYCWNPMPGGWICPRCNSVNASWLPQCFCKAPQTVTSGTITNNNK